MNNTEQIKHFCTSCIFFNTNNKGVCQNPELAKHINYTTGEMVFAPLEEFNFDGCCEYYLSFILAKTVAVGILLFVVVLVVFVLKLILF